MTSSKSGTGLSRRQFLLVSLAAGGGMLIGFPITGRSQGAAAASPPSAFIRIDRAGRVTLILPYVEMGQGAYTSQAQILAEELEVALDSVSLEAAPAGQVYASPLLGEQITGGSISLRGAWVSMRTAGAAARMMLTEAAAKRWGVTADSCRAENGRVMHKASTRSLSYGELAEEAAGLPVPELPALKSPGAFRIVGKAEKRLDSPAKVDGTAKFGIDMRPEGVLHAMVQACPVFGGRLAALDTAPALRVKGVRQVVQIDDAVAVVADHTWAALKALRALEPKWDEGANSRLTTADMIAAADAALQREGLVALRVGDVAAAEASASRRFEAMYRMPMLAHAAMEPLSCTVKISDGRCDVWVGSQIVGRAQRVAAEAAGLPLEKVSIHNQYLGGGFGRRLETDYVSQAVLIAKQVKAPLKVTWSREEDMRHDYYRFHNHSLVNVAVDAAGQPTSWHHRVVAPNIMARWLPAYQKDNIDLDAVDAAHGPYDIPNVLVEFTRNEAPAGLTTGNWRGVGPTRNVFVVESAIDELAHAAGRDAIAYRKALISQAPRTLAVLARAERESGWGSPLPARSGRGVAVMSAFGSHLAFVAQVSVEGAGHVHVERLVCAVDTGIAVNPDIVRAQIEGGVIYGLSAVLHGKITVNRGRVLEGNFDTYQVVRMAEAPKIEVHIIESTEDPGGVGEPGTSGAIAAVANAVFAATGKRIRTLPIDHAQLRNT
jgi:isoquinoline 1-oxidoreductase beta subunit